MSGATAVDLFCGAGGASLGLVRAGYDLRLAADSDPACGMTHKANLPGEFLGADLRGVDVDKILTTAAVAESVKLVETSGSVSDECVLL